MSPLQPICWDKSSFLHRFFIFLIVDYFVSENALRTDKFAWFCERAIFQGEYVASKGMLFRFISCDFISRKDRNLYAKNWFSMKNIFVLFFPVMSMVKNFCPYVTFSYNLHKSESTEVFHFWNWFLMRSPWSYLTLTSKYTSQSLVLGR